LKILFLIQNITWICAGFQNKKYKVYYQALQLQEGLLKRFNLEVFFLNGKKTLTVASEVFQANKFISYSSNVAIDRWAVVYVSMMDKLQSIFCMFLISNADLWQAG